MNASKTINDNFLHHASFLQSRTPGMMAANEEGFCYSDAGLSCDTFNIVYITDGHNFHTAAFEKAINHYQSKNLAYCIWINEENLSAKVAAALTNAGLQQAGSDPGMIIDLKKHNFEDAPGDNYNPYPQISIRKLHSLEEFAQLVSSNWQPPDQNVVHFYRKVSPVIFNQNNIEYFGSYAGEKLVSAIELFPDSNTNAGLYSLCTLQAYRGKGIATSLMKHCLSHLRSKGYATATLQASDDGLRIYQRLGFVQTTRFYEFKPVA